MKQVQYLFLAALMTTVAYAPAQPTQSNYHDYLWATYNQRLGKTDIAQQHYDHLLSLNNSMYPYHGYIKHLFTSKQYKKIVDIMPHLENKFTDAVDIQIIFAQSLETVGKTDQAAKKYIALSEKYKSNSEIAYNAATVLARNNNLDQALAVVKEYLDSSVRRPVDFLFYFLQAQIFYQQKKNTAALKSITECVSCSPDFYQGWLFYGLMHEISGQLQEAIAGYKTYLQLVGQDDAVQQQLINLMFKHQESAQQGVQQNISDALQLFERKQYHLALSAVNECLEREPDYTAARLLKVDTLCALGQSGQACALIKTWILAQQNDDLWFKTLHVLYQSQIDTKLVMTTLLELEKELPSGNPLAILYLADMFVRSKNYPQAKLYLQKSLTVTKDPQIKTVTYYQLALIAYEQQDFKTTKAMLEEGRKLGERYAPLLNLYAYYAATKGHDLALAQSLFNSIKKEDQANPHIAHTQAVIWYKQQKFADAEKLFEKLYKQTPKDVYVGMYYAKSLYKQQKMDRARSVMIAVKSHTHNNKEKLLVSKLEKKWNNKQ